MCRQKGIAGGSSGETAGLSNEPAADSKRSDTGSGVLNDGRKISATDSRTGAADSDPNQTPPDRTAEHHSNLTDAARTPWYEAMGPRIPRKEILAQITASPELLDRFYGLTPERREQFLDMCSGARGIAVCYDPFFKYVFSPTARRGRLSRFLSSLLDRPVRVKNVLPNEGGRIVARSPLVIMDIVVELDDHSYANTEIQREPYQFPGERAASYSSDLVLRQYTSLKGSGGKTAPVRYKRMQNVYTIVIMQKSSAEFHRYPETYIHRGKQVFDSGLNLPLLQEYIFIPLDLFREKLHNRTIETELEAWLGFLAFDDLERIWEISHFDPVFEEMYHDLSEYRREIGEVLGVFSEVLYEMDVEAVKYQSSEEKKKLRREIAEQKQEIIMQKKENTRQAEQIARLEAELRALRRS